MPSPKTQRTAANAKRPREDREKIKRVFLELWTSMAITNEEAAKAAGCTDRTIRRFRQEDPEFNRAVEQGRDGQDAMRVAVVEEALYRTLIGKAPKTVRFVHPAKIIFYLINRAPRRWQNVSTIKTQPEDAISRLVATFEDYEEAERALREQAQAKTSSPEPADTGMSGA